MAQSPDRNEIGIATKRIRLDGICDEFEHAWLTGDRRSIESVLDQFEAKYEDDGPALDIVFRELLLVEIELRQSDGEPPHLDEYLHRFPDCEHVLRDVFLADVDTTPTAIQVNVTGSPSFLETADWTNDRPRESAGSPIELPGYTIIGELGRGGMGIVYKAEQEKLNRIVALKTIRTAELASEEEVRRFLAEAEAAARLDHPNIVPIHEIGEYAGLHFFSMSFVDGQCLKDRISDDVFSTREAAILVRTLADAVHYAHEKGIIHRDLKPANILLDKSGEPRITDFGLAKQIEADSSMTATGQILGTPSFMPPEQAVGDSVRIGPQTDVYSLGAILYALLTGRPPFQAANVLETLKQVIEREPVSPRQLSPSVDRELETICLKCLEKDPAKRYATASGLGADLQRFLDGKPILAHAASRPERVLKWVKRQPLAASLVATVLSAIIAIVSILSIAYIDVSASRDRMAESYHDEQVQRQLATQRTLDAVNAQKATQLALSDLYTNSGVTQMARKNMPEALLWVAHAARISKDDPDRSYANLVRARQCRKAVPMSSRALWNHRKILRNIAFHASGRYLLAMTHDDECTLWNVVSETPEALPGGIRPISAAAWNADGSQLALATAEGPVDLYRFPAGEHLRTIKHPSPVRAIEYSLNGQRLAIAGRVVRVWDVEENRFVTPELVHPQDVDTVQFSSSGDRIVTGCTDRKARVFAVGRTVASSKPVIEPVTHRLRIFPDQRPNAPRFIDRDQGLFTLPQTRRIAWIDAKTGIQNNVRGVLGPEVFYETVSADTKRYAAGGFNGKGVLWNGERWLALQASNSMLFHAGQFTSDGKMLLTADASGVVSGWDAESGKQLDWRLNHTTGVTQVVLSADEKSLAAAQTDGLIRVWNIGGLNRPGPPSSEYKLRMPQRTTELKISRDGRHLLRAGSSAWFGMLRSVRVYELSTFKAVSPEISPGELVLDSALSPNLKQVVTGDARKKLRFWDRSTGKETLPMRLLPSEPRGVEYTPDGTKIICYCVAGEVLTIDPNTGDEVTRWSHGTDSVRQDAQFVRRYRDNAYQRISESGGGLSVGSHADFGRKFMRFSRDSRWLVTSRLDETLAVWDLSNGSLRFPPVSHGALIRSFDLSHDEQFLATAGEDGTVRIWDFVTGESLAATIPHPARVNDVQFSPEGGQIVTACSDRMVRVWDWRQGKLAIPPARHIDLAVEAAFTPDGRWIITGSRKGGISIWDRSVGKPASQPISLGAGGVLRLVVTPNQSHLLVSNSSNAIFTIPLQDLRPDRGISPAELCLLSEILSNQRIESSGVVNLTSREWFDRWRQFRKSRPDYFEFP